MTQSRSKPSARPRPNQRRGDARRQRLLEAALKLLAARDFRKITLVSVCAEADIPHGSARHFYRDLDELWLGLLAELGKRHDHAMTRPVRGTATRSWRDLIGCFIERSARFQRSNPAYAKLTIGGYMSPELKRLDRDADYERARFALQQLEQRFVVPPHRDNERVTYFAIEAVDTAFMLSMRQHGRLTSWWIDRAKRGAIAIMETHFGEMPPRAE